jgi:hypothetical protein
MSQRDDDSLTLKSSGIVGLTGRSWNEIKYGIEHPTEARCTNQECPYTHPTTVTCATIAQRKR